MTYKTFYTSPNNRLVLLFPISHRSENSLRSGIIIHSNATIGSYNQTLPHPLPLLKSIRKFSETGIMSYYQKIWYGVRPKCEINELFVAPVDIKHFSSALYVLLAGTIISTIILVLEVVINRKRKRAIHLRKRK